MHGKAWIVRTIRFNRRFDFVEILCWSTKKEDRLNSKPNLVITKIEMENLRQATR